MKHYKIDLETAISKSSNWLTVVVLTLLDFSSNNLKANSNKP